MAVRSAELTPRILSPGVRLRRIVAWHERRFAAACLLYLLWRRNGDHDDGNGRWSSGLSRHQSCRTRKAERMARELGNATVVELIPDAHHRPLTPVHHGIPCRCSRIARAVFLAALAVAISRPWHLRPCCLPRLAACQHGADLGAARSCPKPCRGPKTKTMELMNERRAVARQPPARPAGKFCRAERRPARSQWVSAEVYEIKEQQNAVARHRAFQHYVTADRAIKRAWRQNHQKSKPEGTVIGNAAEIEY